MDIYILVCDYSPLRNKYKFFRLPSLKLCKKIGEQWCKEHPYGAAKAMTEEKFVDFCKKHDYTIPPLAKGR